MSGFFEDVDELFFRKVDRLKAIFTSLSSKSPSSSSSSSNSTIASSNPIPPIENEFGVTWLHRAACNGDLNEAKRLLENRVVGVNFATKQSCAVYKDYVFAGSTALHIAARLGDFAMVQLLVSHKADVHAQDENKSGTHCLLCIDLSV